MHRISDNGDLEPLPFDNDPELVKWARYGVDQLKRENEQREREAYERAYYKRNPNLDGQS